MSAGDLSVHLKSNFIFMNIKHSILYFTNQTQIKPINKIVSDSTVFLILCINAHCLKIIRKEYMYVTSSKF